MRCSPFILMLAAAAMMTAGCAREKTPPYMALDAAGQKLVSIARTDYKLGVTVRQAGHTTWVYVPLKKSLFTFKAQQEPAGPADRPEKTTVVRFVDARFGSRSFTVRYDIGPDRVYPKERGYASTYSKAFRTAQRHLLTAIARAYADHPAKDNPTVARGGKAPAIFVAVIADITNGIEVRMTFYLGDLKRATTDPYFSEEYARRFVVAEPHGDPALVGDATGAYLDVHPIGWGDFIAEQIAYRVKFFYREGGKKAEAAHGASAQVARCAAAAVGAYGFDGFDTITFRDLAAGIRRTEPRSALIATPER